MSNNIGQTRVETGSVTTFTSEGLTDPCWDQFLLETPLGQFQQSTLWARAKCFEGWKATRTVLKLDDKILGGFQALTRATRVGRIGYVSKGPILSSVSSPQSEYLIDLLREFAKREKLLALVVQPPDFSDPLFALPERDFVPFEWTKVIDATWLLDLTGGYETVFQGFNKTARNHVRRAIKYGFTAREAGRDQLDVFFSLMSTTSERHGQRPNPPSVQHLHALWDAAEEVGKVRLFFVEHKGTPIVGELCIAFGKTFTLWKTGWNASEGQYHPTEFSVDQVLRQACSNGNYKLCDFSSFDRGVAHKMLRGDSRDGLQLSGRDMFHVRFGGFPRLLPQARAYIPNAVLRFACRTFESIRRPTREA